MENGETTQKRSVDKKALADGRYGRTTRALNDVVNALRQCGTEKVLKLPKIAVIGNQSVGKSSLIEAISKIQLPRSMGTCTRCPMEVILRSDSSNTWTCKVAVRVTDATTILPTDFLFNVTSESEHVESILRRAQLAVLNPSKELEFFSHMDDDDCLKYEYVLANERPEKEGDKDSLVIDAHWDTFTSEKRFSNDSVVVEITGADVDVTFIDLPGLIKVNAVCLDPFAKRLTVRTKN